MASRIGLLAFSFAAALSAFVSGGAYALGLGEIHLKSKLNQPLAAEIDLLEVRDLSDGEIIIKLADPADFDRLGIERNYFLTDLDFKVDLHDASHPVIKISSSRPVREPYLDFVIEARWPSGRLLREYTTLLDLPVYSGDQATPVSPVTTQTLSQNKAPAKQPAASNNVHYNPRSSFEGASETPSGAGEENGNQVIAEDQSLQSGGGQSSTSSNSYEGGDSYRVVANDTLWEIALRARPDRDLSVHQTMLAIQRKNPDAFINGNINLLKKGQILRLPDADEIRSIRLREAIHEVALQNEEWHGSTNYAAPIEASKQIGASSSSVRSGEGRLALSTPDDSYNSAEGRVSGSSDNGSPEALEKELNAAQETLDKTQGENKELKSKIGALNEQIKTLEGMIEVSNDNLRELELASKKNKDQEAKAEEKSTLSAVDESSSTAPQAGESPAPEETMAGDTAAAEMGAGDTTSESPAPEASPTPTPEATPTPAKTPKPKPTPVAKKQDMVATALEFAQTYAIYLGLGVVALLALVYFIIRSRATHGFDEEDFLDTDQDFNIDQGGDDSYNDYDDMDAALEQSHEEAEEPEPEPEPEQVAEPETEDVVGEADIYIAYGKYDQAEEMLLKALNRDPGLHEARMKLLEVYAAQENVQAFDPHYAKLREAAPDDLVERAARLREGISGAESFAEENFSSGDSDDDAGLDLDSLDLDSGLDLGDDKSETQVQGAVADDDFSLGLDADADSEPEQEASHDLDFDINDLDTASADDLDLDLDLDLDGGDDKPKASAEDDHSLDFDFDLGDDGKSESSLESEDFSLELDSDEQSSSGELDFDLGDDGDSGDLGLGDFELGGHEDSGAQEIEFESPSAEEEVAEEAPDLSASLESDLESLDSDMVGGAEESDFDLGGLDDVESELDPDKTAVRDDSESADDLKYKTGMHFDLESLDKELDELTSDLDVGDLESSDFSSDESLEESEPVEAMDEAELSFDDTEVAEEDAEQEFESFGEDSAAAETTSQRPSSKGLDFDLPEIDPDSTDEGDLDFLAGSDETATKLDLAAAYIDMGDIEGAKEIINEIMKEGTEDQRSEAQELLTRIED